MTDMEYVCKNCGNTYSFDSIYEHLKKCTINWSIIHIRKNNFFDNIYFHDEPLMCDAFFP